MPVAVVLRPDEATTDQITVLAEALPDLLAAGHYRHPPHIRLATYGEEVDVAGLDEALARAVCTWKKLSISLVGIAVFPGEPCGLSLLPIPISGLLERHFIVDEALVQAAGRHCFERGIWTPHLPLACTEFPADAIEVLTSLWKELIEATLDRIDLVRLKPFETISSRVLSD